MEIASGSIANRIVTGLTWGKIFIVALPSTADVVVVVVEDGVVEVVVVVVEVVVV